MSILKTCMLSASEEMSFTAGMIYWVSADILLLDRRRFGGLFFSVRWNMGQNKFSGEKSDKKRDFNHESSFCIETFC